MTDPSAAFLVPVQTLRELCPCILLHAQDPDLRVSVVPPRPTARGSDLCQNFVILLEAEEINLLLNLLRL